MKDSITILFILSVLMNGTESSGAGMVNNDSNSVHRFIFKERAPFLFIEGQTLTGNLKYFYKTSGKKQSQTHYMVDYNGVGFEVGSGFRIKRLQVYLSGGYMFLNYWSAEHKTTYNVKYNNTIKEYHSTTITEHQYPNRFFFAGIGMEYRIPLSENIHLTPYISAQKWKYSDNKFYPNSAVKEIYYELQDNYALGGGFAFNGIFSDESAISLKCALKRNSFKPAGYFESLGAEALKVSNTAIEFSFGYQFSFSGYQVGFLNYQFSFY